MFTRDQQIAKVDASLKIAGLKIDGAHQLAVGRHDRSLLEENFGELIVRVGKVAVDLESVGELNRCLLVLALIGIALAAFKVALLFFIRIAVTTKTETKCKRQSQDCRDSK